MLSDVLRKWRLFARPGGPGRTVRAGGFVWQVLPAGDALFGPVGPDLPRWLADGSAVVVKAGAQRTVYRVELPGGTVFVKRVRPNSPRAWARELLRPAKARLEFLNALDLRRRGVPAVEPLAWGSAHPLFPGESLIVTRWAGAAEPFDRHLARLRSPVERRAAAVALGELFARLHDAGVAHPDPHPGNLLTSAGPAFTLIDLHAVRPGPPLGWAASVENLVLLNRWFQIRASRSDRARFWASYVRHRANLPPGDPAAVAKDAERRTEASNKRFWTDRLGRYVTSNREYRRLRGRGVSGYATRCVPDAYLEHLLADPDAPFRDPAAVTLKDSRSSTVAEVLVPSDTGLRPAVYKRVRVKSWLDPVKNLARPSAALRSWLFGHNLPDRGLPTPKPLVLLHRKRYGLPAEGYLLVEKVPDPVGLPEAVAAASPFAVRGWADALGRLVRRMHDADVSHRDLKAPNVLMSGPDPVLIDLVGVVAGAAVDRKTRVRDLGRLNASFFHSDRVTRTDRLRFLRAYLCWGLRGRGDWKAWWAEADAATRAKAAKNAKSGRVLA